MIHVICVDTGGSVSSLGSLREFVVPDSQSDHCSEEGIVPATPRQQQRKRSLESVYRQVEDNSRAKREAERSAARRRVRFKSESVSGSGSDIGGLAVGVRHTHDSLQSVVRRPSEVLCKLSGDLVSLERNLETATEGLVQAEQVLAVIKESLADSDRPNTRGVVHSSPQIDSWDGTVPGRKGIGTRRRPYNVVDIDDSTASE